MPLNDEQQKEIKNLRAQTYLTRRCCFEGMEKHLYTAYSVLDHGFVRVVDYMGGDSSITQAARVSYGQGTKSVKNDASLINYLMRHAHSTPFEMCEIKFHVKLPIFVARQWIRHRTANVNEYSARYSILDKEFYIPAQQDLAAQSKINNQGRGEALAGQEALQILEILKSDSVRAYDHYTQMITTDNGRQGLARELARMNLPSNIYTQWYWKIDLHNLFHFLRLRTDKHAQYEIRAYADKINMIVADWVPLAFAAFENYGLNGARLSGMAIKAIRKMLKGQNVTQENSNMSVGEWRELCVLLDKSST